MRGWVGRYQSSVLVVFGSLVVVCCCLVFAASPLALGDATTAPGESCPNEASSGFRAYLAECRAYELVTPVYKDGTELKPVALSEDGSGVIARSLGVLAGDESDTETGSAYELTRSPSGWTVRGISPPASGFPAQRLVAESPGLSSTLWEARTPSESIAAENFYIRDESGALSKIGSLLPPSRAAGPPSGEFEEFLYTTELAYGDASADLSHVVFSISSPSEFGLGWPGDTTAGEESLYEYASTGASRPLLVGINDEGRLISPCTTSLGSLSNHDVYNAMSANGETVFFTAAPASNCHAPEGPEVDELYARLNEVETVPISEPSPQQCAACKTPATAVAGRRAAEFAGASQDGSKVFFLTSQELLSGATGSNLYEYDFDAPSSTHVIRASIGSTTPEVQGVARVSEDGSHVYFVAGGRLSSEPRGGNGGPCLAELTLAEKAQETLAEEQEHEGKPVTTGARCRPKEGADNLYVFERDAAHPTGRVSFIATLSPSDESDWSGFDQRPVQATSDGRFLVFRSVGDLTEGGADTSTMPQIYEYDADTRELVRVSRGRENDQPQGTESANIAGAGIPAQGYFSSTSPATPGKGLAVSADGSVVVFSSAGALTHEAQAAAAAKMESDYEYRSSVASGGSISQGDVYLISTGSATPGAGIEGLDASGRDVLFRTVGSLVKVDDDTQVDTYDARSDGGFLAPDPPAGCSAEACGGSLYTPPSSAALGPVSSEAGAPSLTGSSVPARTLRSGPAPTILSRAQRLAAALRACERERQQKRAACKAGALKRYGVKVKAKRGTRGNK